MTREAGPSLRMKMPIMLETDGAEVVQWLRALDDVPEKAVNLEVAADQAEHFDAANQQRNDDGNESVVVRL